MVCPACPAAFALPEVGARRYDDVMKLLHRAPGRSSAAAHTGAGPRPSTAAVGEAYSNAVRHGEPAYYYEVGMWVDRSKCVIEVAHNRCGFHPPAVVQNPPAIADHGRDLSIIAALVGPRRVPPMPPDPTSQYG